MILMRTSEGTLELSGSTLSLEINNPFFEEDAVPGTISLPFDLSWTRENLRQLGFPQRSRRPGGPAPVPVGIYIDGPLWRQGALVYRECEERRKKLSYNFAGDAADLQKQIQGLKISGLALGTVTLDLRPDAPLYALLPVRNKAFYGDKNPEFKGILNHYAAGAYSTGAGFAIAPQPRLVPALRKIMALFGYTLTGSWLEQAEVQQLVFYSDRAADLPAGGVAPDFLLARHLPDISVGELLVALQKFFCLGYSFNSKRKELRITPLSEVLADRSQYIERRGVLRRSKPNQTNGFLLRLAPGGDDELDKTLGTLGRELRVGAGQQPLEAKAGSLHMVREADPHNEVRQWLLPAIEAKGASPAYETGDESRCGLRLLFDRGLQPDSNGNLYPLGAADTVNYAGVSVGRKSLRLDGPAGLYAQNWQAWLDFRSRAVETEYEVQFSLADLLALDPARSEMLDRHLHLWQRVALEIDGRRKLAKAIITYQEIL